MGFHEVRFPVALSFGSSGGPERRTEIVTLTNGYEERNTPWEHSRRRYDAGIGLRSLADLEAVVAFFEARRGQLYGFRWKDWSDWTSCPHGQSPSASDQRIGTGDGVTRVFQLSKNYEDMAGSYRRPVRKPVEGSVRVSVDEAELPDGWAVDPASGNVTFDIVPAEGARIGAGFAFDVPVRFDTDRLSVSVASFRAGEMPSIPVVEVRL
jgi:uncharacterized protein (TIGR02217 family)